MCGDVCTYKSNYVNFCPIIYIYLLVIDIWRQDVFMLEKSIHAGKWNIDSSVAVVWLILLVCFRMKLEQERMKSENAFWCKKQSKKNCFPPSFPMQTFLAEWEGNMRCVLEIEGNLCKWKLHYSARIMHCFDVKHKAMGSGNLDFYSLTTSKPSIQKWNVKLHKPNSIL